MNAIKAGGSMIFRFSRKNGSCWFRKIRKHISIFCGSSSEAKILNALVSIEKTLPQVERRLETLQQQLAEAKEEVQRPFPQEAELNEKSARLAELNALLDMDEKGDDATLGMDEEVTESEIPAPKREIERSADSVKRPSILAQLHEKQAERMAEPKPQKKKSHDMEL